MTNTYIQDKLLEKHICRFNDGECNCDCYIAGMQDYHNHIVEKAEEDLKLLKKVHKIELDAIALKSLEEFIKWSENRKQSLQDTNSSNEHENFLNNHFPGLQDSLDKLTIHDTNPNE